jgi:transcription elongation factor GreA
MQVPKRRNDWKSQLGPADEYLTPDAIANLKAELIRIEKARPAAVSELTRTREMGDLSENFAYHVAKGKVMGMDGEIFRIKERLKNAKIIKVGDNAGGIIAIGSIITVEVNEKQKEIMLVGTQEADPATGKISFHSPLGAALNGKMSGEVADVEVSGKKIVYKILKVN